MINASIIIPTYNRGKLLCNTLKNLLEHLPADVEIVVVDQSEEMYHEVMETTRNYSTLIHYYKIPRKGLPHARNYGLKRAIGEIVIFCDDDVIPTPDFIKNHLQNYKEKDVGGVGGRILQNGKHQHPFSDLECMSKANLPNHSITDHPLPNHPPSRGRKSGNLPTPIRPSNNERMEGSAGLSHHNKIIGKVRWWDTYLIDNFDATTRTYIDHVQGCNMSFRKTAIRKAGGFDERFGGSAHLEETDLCMRIRKAGYKIVFDPGAELIHLKDASGGCRAENNKQWFSWYGHNNMLFFLKNFRRHLFPVFITSSFIRLILSAYKRHNPMIIVWGIGGYWAGITTYSRNICLC
jgi:GT2 family glycosyltransferase